MPPRWLFPEMVLPASVVHLEIVPPLLLMPTIPPTYSNATFPKCSLSSQFLTVPAFKPTTPPIPVNPDRDPVLAQCVMVSFCKFTPVIPPIKCISSSEASLVRSSGISPLAAYLPSLIPPVLSFSSKSEANVMLPVFLQFLISIFEPLSQ